MGGGLMQLVAYGAQDIYLTGNPQITFFKVVYRRYTNFSMECIEQTLSGTSTLNNSNSNATCTIQRSGDLVAGVIITSSTPGILSGDKLISEVEIEIGGQTIDKHYREWMQIWSELTTPDSKAAGYKAMTGAFHNGLSKTGTAGVNLVQVPLQFWFCRNPGLALPLIALQYHEVKVKFTWGTSSEVGVAAICKVWVEYIFLDTDERRRFAQISHEYLVEQLQLQADTSSANHKLNLNHPVKELIWTGDSYHHAKITLNGHDRFEPQEEEYFQLRQPLQHHTSVPGMNIPLVEKPTMLSTPEASGTYTLQAKSADDTELIATALSADLQGTMAMLTSLTADAAKTQSGDGEKTLVIREATASAKTFKVGDILHFTINARDEQATGATSGLADSISNQFVQVKKVRTSTVITTDSTYTELTLDRNPLTQSFNGTGTNLTLTDGDLLIMNVIGRCQDNKARCSSLTKKINCYSFALKPEGHQPSGTCNFSRIDTAYLRFGTAINTAIYATNYNVLRIMSGMGGLAYSN